MLNTAVQNSSTLNALSDCLNAAVYLRDHAALDHAVTHQLGHLGHLQAVNDTVRVVDIHHQAAHVGQQDELFRAQRDRQLAGRGIRVDVVIGFIVDPLRDGVIKGGMIPKVDCCVEAVRSGVKSAIILDGRVPHSILIELLSNEGIGTMLVN